ncbi:hypothetical protein GQ53DRAFT_34475 [Thozetella sp. PMI_491]|nr:hypothetical protein GQ53DRAFT_34475 [Thozetella sp. PMI_491]
MNVSPKDRDSGSSGLPRRKLLTQPYRRPTPPIRCPRALQGVLASACHPSETEWCFGTNEDCLRCAPLTLLVSLLSACLSSLDEAGSEQRANKWRDRPRARARA